MRASILKNISWSVFGTGIYNLALWLVLIVLARHDASGMLVGRYVIAYALCLPVTVFVGMQLRQTLATDRETDLAFADYWTARLLALPIIPLVLLLTSWLMGHARETRDVVLGLAAVKVLDSVADLFAGLYQQQERLRWMGLSFIVRGVLVLGGIGVGVLVLDSLPVGLGLAATGVLVELLLLEIPWVAGILREQGLLALRPRWNPTALRKVVLTALPLGLGTLVAGLIQQMPQYLVERLLGETAVGVFGAMYLPVVAMGMLVGAVGEAVAPRVASLAVAGDCLTLRLLIIRLLATVGLVGAIAVGLAHALGAQVLNLVYGPVFAEHANVFVWLVASAAILSLAGVLVPVLVGLRRFQRVFWLTLGLLPVNVAAGIAAVKSDGLRGMAVALFALNGLATVAVSLLSWHAYRAVGHAYRAVGQVHADAS